MSRTRPWTVLLLWLAASPALGQINRSQEFPGVYHSPAADATPPVFRSVLQLEIVLRKGDGDPQVQYANGTVVSRDGLLVSVIAAPAGQKEDRVRVESAAILKLDGSGMPAEVLMFAPDYGVAVLRARGLDRRPLPLSKVAPVARRRLMWHAVFKDGRKTFLYTRPLRVHQSRFSLAGTTDLCRVIDRGSSSLNADRSGSALLAHDGSLVAIMGRLKHWNVRPKNQSPRTKTAWAVPAQVLERLLKKAGQAGKR